MLPLPSLSVLLLTCNARRAFLATTSTCCATILAGPPTAAQAEDRNAPSDLYLARPMGIAKDGSGGGAALPSAPLEYLLPAARVGVYIYRTLAVAEELARSRKEGAGGGERAQTSVVRELDDLFTSPPQFVRSGDPAVSRGDPYNLPPLVGEVAAAQQKQKERKLQSVDVGLAPQLFEVGELMGERRSWNRLVRAERAREDASETRRALNIYTTNLNFNRKEYVYGGSREEKSRMIREDRLPTATEVIRSDLDARDLYRNAVQTALEDCAAEFAYQKKSGFEDVGELVGLLEGARTAIDKWFGFIPDEDIREALEVVMRESK